MLEQILPSLIREERPWGSYSVIDEGERYKVKSIDVNPGHRLSLQKHYHRAEHWVVVEGTASIELDGEIVLLHENQSIYSSWFCASII